MSPTREWLELLYGRSPGWFTVITFRNGRPTTKAFNTAELDKVAKAIERAGQTHDVYVSVATYKTKPMEGRRGSLSDVQSIPGWWADLDIGTEGHKTSSDGKPNPANEKQAMSILDGLPEPSAVIHSGGGLQVWWLFEEPWVFDDPKAAQKASTEWQMRLKKNADAKGYHVDTLGDLPRILRAPGTANHKTDNIRPVVMKKLSDQRYSASELTVIGETDDETPSPPRGFTTWEAILEPHGWTKAGKRIEDGAQLWVRPGKDAREGHSAVTDPYGVPVMVNFSATAGLPTGPGQRLTKFKVWAFLNYGGDLTKARAALEDAAAEDPTLLAERAARFIPLDWPEVFAGAEEPVDWLVEPFLERGAQVAFYSKAKAGKSLLWLELAADMATGRLPFEGLFDTDPAMRHKVLYIDMENSVRDIGERLKVMGFEADDLTGWLWYYSFPGIGYLDTKQGALDVVSLAITHNVDAVVIDTLSRVCEGDENSNDTFNNFYKHTGVALKSRGIALLRLDHSGKDEAKGMRGASAKTTDVDVVWQLTADDEKVYLNRTYSRNAHGDPTVVLRRVEEDFFYHSREHADEMIVEATKAEAENKKQVTMIETLRVLQENDIGPCDSLRAATEMWKSLGRKGYRAYVEDTQRARRAGTLTEDGEFIEAPAAPAG